MLPDAKTTRVNPIIPRLIIPPRYAVEIFAVMVLVHKCNKPTSGKLHQGTISLDNNRDVIYQVPLFWPHIQMDGSTEKSLQGQPDVPDISGCVSQCNPMSLLRIFT
jgi:hypothetical protein